MDLVDYCSFPLDFYYLELKWNQVPLKQQNRHGLKTKNEQQDSNPIFIFFRINSNCQAERSKYKTRNEIYGIKYDVWRK